MARKETASLPEDLESLALSPEAEAAMREVTEGPAVAPAPVAEEAPAVPARPSAAARNGIENPNDTHRVGTAAVPGKVSYVYGPATVTIVTN